MLFAKCAVCCGNVIKCNESVFKEDITFISLWGGSRCLWKETVLHMNTVCFCPSLSLLPLQSSQSGSAQRAPARGGALSWRRPNLQDAGVTICVKPTTAAAQTSTNTVWKQVSPSSLLLVELIMLWAGGGGGGGLCNRWSETGLLFQAFR